MSLLHLSTPTGPEKRLFGHRILRYESAETRSRQLASTAPAPASGLANSAAETRSNGPAPLRSSPLTLCDVGDPLEFEEFLEQHQLELEADELRDLLEFPRDDVDVGIIQRRYRTVRPLAPDKTEIERLEPHVQECVRQYLSDWMYAHRRYSELSSAAIYRRTAETLVESSAVDLHEYEIDGVSEFQQQVQPQLQNGKSACTSARNSWLMSGGSEATQRGSWASSHFDLKNSAADALLPGLLERVPADSLDLLNYNRRQLQRPGRLLELFPRQDEQDVIERRPTPALPSEHRPSRIMVKCLRLKLELEFEPIFASMALYDAGRRKKISENFYFDMNSEPIKNMVRDHVPFIDISTTARSCIFDISFPSPDIFLVIKLEKVLQGDINESVEPYVKDDKSREKAQLAASAYCQRLGQYRMPFAWTAIYLMNIVNGINSMGKETAAGDREATQPTSTSLERKVSQSGFDQLRRRAGGDGSALSRRSSFERRSLTDKQRSFSVDEFAQNLHSFRPVTLTVSSFFKQEADRMKDDDLFKHLLELKRPGNAMKKLKCIGGTLKLDISPAPDELKFCLSPELAKLRPFPDEKCRPCKEILEFPPEEIYIPHFLYRNLMFVSPKSVNFTNYPNKPGISARNLTVKVQFMNGESASATLPVIFGRSSCPEFVSYAHSTVSYHNRTPDFYDEIKIRLPANLTDAHHILFTFYHISCQRKAEQTAVETPIGYTWLPVFRDGRLNTGEKTLPVLLEPPPANYPYITPEINLPGVRWLDGHKPLFTVTVMAESSVYPQDRCIDNFLCLCRVVETGVIPPRIGENNVEPELIRCIQQLSECGAEPLIGFLPLLLDRLLLLLVRPPIVAGQMINTGPVCFEAFGQLVRKLTTLLSCSNDLHGRSDLLMTYIKYQCTLPNMSVDHQMYNASPLSTPLYMSRTSSLPRTRNFNRSTSNPNMTAPCEADSEVGMILGRALDRTASLRTGVSQELLVPPRVSASRKIVHEELALQWVVASGRSRELATDNPWFFFELIVKSMLCHLASSGRMDTHRRYRFPERFTDDIAALVNSTTNDVITRQTTSQRGEVTTTVSNLNCALAFFLNDLLSVMDRSFVLMLVRSYCRQMSSRINTAAEPSQLMHLMLDFLRIVCSHEHYFALNLPFCTPLSCASSAASPTPSVGSTGSQCSYLSSTLVAGERRPASFTELSVQFCQQHYLAGLVLRQLQYSLKHSNPGLHSKSVHLLHGLLSWHDSDPRFQDPTARSRIALLYLPLLPIALDSLTRLHAVILTSGREERVVSPDDTAGSSNLSISPLLNGGTHDTPVNGSSAGYIRADTSRELLVCVLWTLKNVRAEVLRTTWCEYSSQCVQQLLQLLHICISCFEYKGRDQTLAQQAAVNRVVDTKSRLEDMLLGQGSARSDMIKRRASPLPPPILTNSSGASTPTTTTSSASTGGSASSERLRWRKDYTSAGSHWRQDSVDFHARCRLDTDPVSPAVEGSLCAEASLIVLDTLETVIQVLSSQDRLQGLLGLAFRVLLHALSCNQSTTVLANMFATQRSLVTKYPALLFDEETEQCADLCLRLLQHCSSAVSAVRSQASASLYLLMRQNFEIGNNFARVKMQVTMSLSSLVGTSQTFNEEYLRRSLKTVLEYAADDRELEETTFPGQVNDLVFNLHMILSDTVKMKEFQEDHEMLLDLMYRIAKGYQNSPDLRLTWLDNMAKKHRERGQYAEAGMCYVQSAALVSEYLNMLEPKTYLPHGAAGFEKISPNALAESAVSDDVVSPDEEGICTGRHFSEAGLVTLLEQTVIAFSDACLYEAVGDVYKLLIPIVENSRDYRKLAAIHSKLQEVYGKVVSTDGRRLFWTYYRVGFYGFKFGDLDGEEFIYKEPALTKLAEISNRLESFYADRFGPANVHIIKASHRVDPSKLNPEIAYIQITYSEPYLDLWEQRHRAPVFERNFNIRTFMYATPYTLDGRAHGDLHEQFKRKTVLTVANSFPYVKTRVPVVSRREIVLTPIEVAIEDIRQKTAELAVAVAQTPPDTKILQMVLQGCIGTTVNQGPMEVANVFLNDLFTSQKDPTDLQKKLRICFKDFSKKCLDALRKNRSLIKSDQHEYQRELEKNYQRFVERLKPMLSPQQAHTLTLSKSRSRELVASSQHQHQQQQQQQRQQAHQGHQVQRTSPFV